MEGHDYYSAVFHYGADVSITDSRSYSSGNAIQVHKTTTTEQLPLVLPIPLTDRQDHPQSMQVAVSISTCIYLQYFLNGNTQLLQKVRGELTVI